MHHRHPSLCIVHYALCITLALAALGAAKAAPPATYLNYIESNGTSQYIDLGIEGRPVAAHVAEKPVFDFAASV